jgi:hypothetical protein
MYGWIVGDNYFALSDTFDTYASSNAAQAITPMNSSLLLDFETSLIVVKGITFTYRIFPPSPLWPCFFNTFEEYPVSIH